MIIIRHIIPLDEVIPKNHYVEGVLDRLDKLHEDINVVYSDIREGGEVDRAIVIEYGADSGVPKEYRSNLAFRKYIELIVEDDQAYDELRTTESKRDRTKFRVENFTKGIKKSEL